MFEREQLWYVKICTESNIISKWLITRAEQVDTTQWGVQAQVKNRSDTVWPHFCLMDLIVTLSSGSRSIKGQPSREQIWRGLQTIGKTRFLFSHRLLCLYSVYSFISLTSKGGTSAQQRSVKYVNLYQVCSAASYLGRFVAFSCFEFSSTFPFRFHREFSIDLTVVLQIREICSPVFFSPKEVTFLFSFCLSGKLC